MRILITGGVIGTAALTFFTMVATYNKIGGWFPCLPVFVLGVIATGALMALYTALHLDDDEEDEDDE